MSARAERRPTMPDDSPHALRLTFAWRGSQISLVGGERVAMIVPASVPEPDVPATAGYSFALLDASGGVIYRRPLHAPIRLDAEAFSPGRGRAIERVPLASTEGRFTLLVPDRPDAFAFRLSGPADPARPDDPATELLRLDVDALRKASRAPGAAGPATGRGTKG
jgi:hypothetical protein